MIITTSKQVQGVRQKAESKGRQKDPNHKSQKTGKSTKGAGKNVVRNKRDQGQNRVGKPKKTLSKFTVETIPRKGPTLKPGLKY